jgi:hypothetical protein
MKIEQLAAILKDETAPKPVKGLLGPAPSVCFPRPSMPGKNLTIVTLNEEESLNLPAFFDRMRAKGHQTVDAHLGAVGE